MASHGGYLTAVNSLWSGLGNRLRFTLSAKAVADAEDREFSYVWPTAAGVFEPSLTDLWEYSEPCREARDVVPNLTERPSRWGRPRALTQLRQRRQWIILGSSVLQGDGSERRWEDALSGLQLNQTLARRVAAQQDRLPPAYVGVQIRAHARSHLQTLKDSPVDWFIERMAAMALVEDGVHFYLSCDDPAAQQRVQAAIPRVHVLPSKASSGYNTAEGVSDGVVDLYVLSRSRHLLGPHMSSFVELAWIIGGKRQPLETSRVRLSARVDLKPSSFPEPSRLYARHSCLVWRDRLDRKLPKGAS